jgi:hypothetical protein
MAASTRAGSRVIFTGYRNSSEEIAAYSNGEFSTVAKANFNVQRGFTGLSAISSSATRTTFVGTTARGVGIYVHSADAPLATVIESGSAGFTSVDYPSIDAAGHVAFQAIRNGTAGIYAVREAGGAVVPVYTASQVLPGSGGEKMACLENPSINDAVVVFFGSTCNGVSVSSALRNRERMFRTRQVTEHAIHDMETHLDAGIFLADLRDSFALAREEPPREGFEPKLTAVANFKTAVPGAASGVTFTGFSNPSVGEALVAFVGSTSAGELGVYTYDIATRELTLVADTTTKVPGESHTFSDFPYPPSVSGRTCVFYAVASGLASGVYAKIGAAGSIASLVTMADKAPSGEAFVFIGSGARASDATAAAFYGVTNSLNGIYTVPLPQQRWQNGFSSQLQV